MANKQIKWPDLSAYGVGLKRWMGPDDQKDIAQSERYAVIKSTGDELDEGLKTKLTGAGFEEAWIGGDAVMRRQGSFGSADLKTIFPKVISKTGFAHTVIEGDAEVEAVCNLRGEFGPAPVVEEAVEEEFDIDANLEEMVEALAIELEDDAPEAEEAVQEAVPAPASPEPVAEPEKAADEVSEVAEEKPEPVAETVEDVQEAPEPVVQVEEVPEAVAKAPAPVAEIASAVGLDDLGDDFEGFEAYLIYQGIPALAREEFLAALPKLVDFLKSQEQESDMAKNAWKNVQHPGQIRKMFQEGCSSTDKAFAKTKIIEPLYPLAFDYCVSKRDADMRQTYETFAQSSRDEMDAFTEFYTSFVHDSLNEDGKSYTSQLERGMRALGSRLSLDMCRAGENARKVDRDLRENDVRFIAMDMKGTAVMDNTKQGFINPVRKNEARRDQVIAKFEEMVPQLGVDTPSMTA